MHRQKYETLKEKHMNYNVEPPELDPTHNNPLSQNEDAPWYKHFKRERLLKMIKQDVERTYPEYQFFEKENIKTLMTNILFVYSSEKPDLSYRQGMHELLAPIVFVLWTAQTNNDGTVQNELLLSSSRYLEHDSFCLFNSLMATASDWFISRPQKPKTDDEWVLMNEATPFSEKCHYIHVELLRCTDPGLFTHFCDLDVEPQIYLLRWIRCLFGREFPLEQTLIIWDALFSSNKLSSFVDYVAVAMLVEIREELLSQDRNGVLALLFKYPHQDLSISSIITRAIAYNQRKTVQVGENGLDPTLTNITPVKNYSHQMNPVHNLRQAQNAITSDSLDQ
eukprot:TRINITY_DN1714_c0_g1_i1.p1 TRINITY_DN1714_c0_g1~~TRINITY_DN1714_c0_g1_i1.p1  ORF type:complete len:336 (-),score=58.82 TRINITY_DN1714_c0_g1_i1:320-1327(-)